MYMQSVYMIPLNAAFYFANLRLPTSVLGKSGFNLLTTLGPR
jgi:hypothetical protein